MKKCTYLLKLCLFMLPLYYDRGYEQVNKCPILEILPEDHLKKTDGIHI